MSQPSATTRVAAVIGWPVRHSLSPVLYNTAFELLGLDWVYVAYEVPPERGAAAVSAMRSLGLAGMSVTMPHKEVVAAAVDERTPVAEALQAVNCVSWDDSAAGRLVGDNTDAAGLIDALHLDGGFDPAGRRCLVLGAGGAGRAAVWGLAQAGAAEVVVVNRSAARGERAAALAGPVGRLGSPDDVPKADLVVNATPLGMSGTADDASTGPALPVDPALLHGGQLVVDLIYHPATTPLLRAGAERGARVLGGLPMLVHQAAHQLRRWTGAVPPVAEMTAAARSACEKKNPPESAS